MDGIGVLINMLTGEETSAANINAAVSKIIKAIKIDETNDGALVISFTDGITLRIYDDGRSCCEHRYMTSDDDLSYFVGSTFLGARMAEAADVETEYDDVHEVQFLIVKTSLGEFTCETHNVHNGYYGGFYMRAELSIDKTQE